MVQWVSVDCEIIPTHINQDFATHAHYQDCAKNIGFTSTFCSRLSKPTVTPQTCNHDWAIVILFLDCANLTDMCTALKNCANEKKKLIAQS